VARLRSALATSAGGIVVSVQEGRRSLVVGMRRRGRDAVTWTLPKGTPHAGETTEETALREVTEETGLEVRIIEPLSAIEYGFVQDATRIRKTVHYFLMEPIGGDLALHDAEFERVRWVAFEEAGGLLSFATERELVASTAERLDASSSASSGRAAPPAAAGAAS
jgi:8-oxo-dGTP pyrophosphatase MutT (NUDIX family)